MDWNTWSPWPCVTRQPSFPTRERGLKCKSIQVHSQWIPSFPTRERGLKCQKKSLSLAGGGRSPRGNVDWNKRLFMSFSCACGRSPRVNVDWNSKPHSRHCTYSVVPHAGTWIEIIVFYNDISDINVVPHAGTWIEMVVRRFEGCCTCRYPHGNADWNNKEEIKRCGIWGVLYAEQNRKNRKSQLILAFNRHWCYNKRN